MSLVPVPSPDAFPGRITSTGLVLWEGLSYEEWAALGPVFYETARSAMWLLGDWIRYGEANEERWGVKYVQALEVGWDYQTAADAHWVCERFPEFSWRHENLTFTHHHEAARLSDAGERRAVLALAEENGWSTRDVRAEVTKRRKRSGEFRERAKADADEAPSDEERAEPEAPTGSAMVAHRVEVSAPAEAEREVGPLMRRMAVLTQRWLVEHGLGSASVLLDGEPVDVDSVEAA